MNRWIWILISILSILIGVGGVLAARYLLGDGNALVAKDIPYHVFEFISSALIVFGVTIILGEVGLLSKFFHRELGRTFIEVIAQPEYLRETFCESKRKEIRDATVESLCQDSIVKGPGTFLEVLDSLIYPMLKQPLRFDLNVTYTQRIDQIGAKKIVRVFQRSKWTYKNPYVKPITHSQRFYNTLDHINGIEDKELFSVNKFIVNGDDRIIILERTINEDGKLVRFSGEQNITIERSVDVEVQLQKIIPWTEYDHFSLGMEAPTKDLTLTYNHPENFNSRVYFFGLGTKDAELKDNQPNYKVWSYEGWLLKKHGFMLYWWTQER